MNNNDVTERLLEGVLCAEMLLIAFAAINHWEVVKNAIIFIWKMEIIVFGIVLGFELAKDIISE